MRLRWTELKNFRNYMNARVELHPRANLFLGQNGMGKTNFLEAIYVLATATPMRGHRTRDLVMEGAEKARVSGRVESADGAMVDIAASFGGKSRELELRGKPVERTVDYFGHLEVVSFTPDDVQLFSGAPADRRRFLDRIIFNHDPGYLDIARRFYRSLSQRNRLLDEIREGRRPMTQLEVWDRAYADLAAQIARRRDEMTDNLSERLAQVYENIFGSAEFDEIDLHHRSEIILLDPEPTGEKLLPWLEEKRKSDVRRGNTQLGPHRDDLLFEIRGRPVKTHASQGQRRTLVLGLKLAEVLSLSAERGELPVVLLDDLSSELDPVRTDQVLRYLAAQGSQLVVTSTAEGAWVRLFEGEISRFEVSAGKIEPLLT